MLTLRLWLGLGLGVGFYVSSAPSLVLLDDMPQGGPCARPPVECVLVRSSVWGAVSNWSPCPLLSKAPNYAPRTH